MKQVIQNLKSGELKVDEVPAPAVQPGGVLIENAFSLISAGTEKSTVTVARKNLLGKALERPEMAMKVLEKVKKDGVMDTLKMVLARLDSPAALGYSCAGRVVAVGDGVDEFRVGDPVACAGQNYASHAEIVAVPKNLCVRIPDGVSCEDAAYVTLGAIALQGVRQADPKIGDVVAVIGLGLLGQITVQLLKANGCIVVASDVTADKLDLARSLGADFAASPEELLDVTNCATASHGVDAVIITASSKDNSPVVVAGEITRKKGVVVVVGAVHMDVPRESFYGKELALKLSTSYGPGRYDSSYEEKGLDYPYGYVRWTEKRNMQAFLQLVQQGKVNVRQLTTHRFNIDEAAKPYQMIVDGSEPFLGILLAYPQGDVAAKTRTVVEVYPRQKEGDVRLAIVGAGNHVRDMLLPALRRLPAVQINAVCTGSGYKAKGLAEKEKIGYCTSDFTAVLNDSNVNAVLIGTRHDLHADQVCAALQAGKHVFVEKPLCLDATALARVEAAYAQAARLGYQLMVGFNRRFSSHAGEIKRALSGRQNPLVMSYRVNAGALPPEHWTQDRDVGGGRIIGEGCHFIDFMQYVCGAPPVTVYAASVAKHASGITQDQSVITTTFADGSVGALIYAAGGSGTLPKERCEILGDGVAIVMDDFILTEIHSGGRKKQHRTKARDKGFEGELSEFVRAITTATTASLTFAEITAATRATFAAVASMADGSVHKVEDQAHH